MENQEVNHLKQKEGKNKLSRREAMVLTSIALYSKYGPVPIEEVALDSGLFGSSPDVVQTVISRIRKKLGKNSIKTIDASRQTRYYIDDSETGNE